MTTSILLLIRHGENDWVGTDRLAGRTPGVHLNDRGREQAAALAERLRDHPLAAIYSSPMERCMETAQPTADALDLPVQIAEGMLEADFGEWQGKELKELSKLPEWHMVQHYPSAFRFPDGESMRNMQFRAVSTLERIAEQHPDQVVAVFSHSDVIRTCMAHFLGTPLDLFQRIAISTASVSAVAFHDRRPMVLFVNHAAELPRLEIKKDEKEGDGAEKSE